MFDGSLESNVLSYELYLVHERVLCMVGIKSKAACWMWDVGCGMWDVKF